MNIRLFAFLVIIFAACNTPAEEKKTVIDLTAITLASDLDPVCEMSVKNGVADTLTHNGVVYGFCNTACKEEFQKTPEKYLE